MTKKKTPEEEKTLLEKLSNLFHTYPSSLDKHQKCHSFWLISDRQLNRFIKLGDKYFSSDGVTEIIMKAKEVE